MVNNFQGLCSLIKRNNDKSEVEAATNRGIGTAKAAKTAMSPSVKAKERENMDT